ncbi:MAG: thioredoxin family protein [Spirochaetaceae bacterium]|nr:thioredoxin family protein [Spirochaetaceae bacterium]
MDEMNQEVNETQEQVKAEETVEQENISSEENTVSAEKKAKGKKGILIAVISVLAAAVIGCGIWFLVTNATASKSWINDFEAAKTAAEKGKKSIMLLFSGDEWDDNTSKNLKESVFYTDAFIKKAGKRFVLVNLDIPLDEDGVSEEELEKLYVLAATYALERTPTLVLLDKDGASYGTITDTQVMATTDELFKAVDLIESNKKKIASLTKKIAVSKGIQKVKYIDEMFEATDVNGRESMIDYIREIPELDPSNKTGVLGKYMLFLAYFDVASHLQNNQPQEAVNCFLNLTKIETLTAEEKQQAYYMAAYLSAYTGQGSKELILDYLKKAIDMAPDSEVSESIRQTYNYIEQTPTENEETEPGL